MGVRVRCRNESPIITVGVKNVAATKKCTLSAFTCQGDADGVFWFWGCCLLWVSTTRPDSQGLLSGSYATSSWGSQEKKTWCVAGESMDAPTWQRALTFIVPCPWVLGQTREDCPSTASVLSRSRTSWLLSVSKAQINAERPRFWVYWGDQDKFASAFAQHS